MKNAFKRFLPDFLFVLAFAVVTLIYCSPVLNNKMLIPNDPVQSYALAKESMDYQDKFGDVPWWTNSAFGGMPTYFISSSFPNGILTYIRPFIRPMPGNFAANDIFLMLIGAYILFMAFQKNRWVASLGAMGYTFCTLTLLFLEAGHSSKIQALAFAPVVFAGLIYAYQNKRLQAILAFSFGLGFEINSNHLQITYYLALVLVVFTCFLIYYAYKEGVLKAFAINLLFIGIGGGLACTTQAARLLSTLEYSKETIRGPSELTLASEGSNSNSEGLSKGYAFSWSYGKTESFTFLIPHFSGGASSGSFPENSATGKALTQLGVPATNIDQYLKTMPSYWGDQIFVSGPAYLGAILCFLFVLGLLLSKSKFKWPLLVCTVLLLFISWGDNLKVFGYFMFDYIPMYNKFRAVNMGISLMQLFIVSIGVLGIKELLTGEVSLEKSKKPLFISLGLTAGVCLLFALIPSLFFDFTAQKDAGFIQSLTQSFGNNAQAANTVYNAILEDRETLVKQDSMRSLIFILLAAALIYAFLRKLVKTKILVGGLLLLVSIDLWQVDKEYFNNDDFQNERNLNLETQFAKTAADNQILADTGLDYRVLNTTTGFWSSAKESYHHKSIGGYHGAKLKRAQELYEHAMIKDGRLNMPILNMMNTKYFIINGANGLEAQQNPDALGNAWYVDSVIYAANANEEMTTLVTLDVANNAVVDERFRTSLNGTESFKTDSSSIVLTEYLPNNLKYKSTSDQTGFVVFSEMYYRGNEDWKSYIDGVEVPHIRTNYALRGLLIPAGNHEIEFQFRPSVVKTGNRIDLISSILFVLFIGASVFFTIKTKKNSPL